MQSRLNPYISFNGNAREAAEFYQTVFGGKLDMTTYEQGGMSANQGDPQQIMHAMLVADNGMTLMVSDVPDGMEYKPGTTISISLSGDNSEELTGYFNKLSDGGVIAEPLVMAPWGDTFGMVTDKFGTFWMVNIAGKHE